MSNNYFNNIKKYISNFIINTIKSINESNILFYFFYFFFFFTLYFLSNLSSTSNIFDSILNKISENKYYLIIFYCLISFLIFSLLGIGLYFSFKKNIKDKKSEIYVLTGSIFCLFISIYIGVGIIKKYIIKLPDLFFDIMKYSFYVINSIFIIIFFMLFYENINEKYILEVFITLELITIFIFLSIVNTHYKFRKYNNLLLKNDFNLLTTNCKSFNESFYDSNYSAYNNSITDILKTNGNDYLRFYDKIPISFLNPNTKNYQNLTLNDFYYPSSCYSYLADNPLNGTPNIKALELAITKYKSRIIELDIYTDIEDSDPRSKLVVRPKDLKKGTNPLLLDDCFEIINKFAWIPNNSNQSPYPLILILNLNFEDYESLYIKLYNNILKYFSKY